MTPLFVEAQSAIAGARRRLFILTTSASEGRLAIIKTESGLVCVIALDDLVDVVMEPGPTLAEVMEAARGATVIEYEE